MSAMKELILDEEALLRLINLCSPGGEYEHRYLFHLLKQIHQMGYCWRDEWKVTLCHGDHEPEISEVYAEYCDLLAQGKNVSFNKETGEIVNDDDSV